MKKLRTVVALVLAAVLAITPVNNVKGAGFNFAVALETDSTTTNTGLIMSDLNQQTVSVLEPFYITGGSDSEVSQLNAYTVIVPMGYKTAAGDTYYVSIPVKINKKGLLAMAVADASGTEVDASLYADEACSQYVGGYDNRALIEEAGTYYIGVATSSAQETADLLYGVALSFISSDVQTLTNKKWGVAATIDYNTPVYIKFKVAKTSKVVFDIESDYSTYVTICNSKKTAITTEESVYTDEGKAAFSLAKGTYYVRIKTSSDVIKIKPTITAVTSGAGTSKAKAKTIKVNGGKKTVVLNAAASTSKVQWLKFTNPKTQAITVNILTNMTSGDIEVEFFNSKGTSFGVKTVYPGVNNADGFSPYVGAIYSSEGTLPKGTYYMRFKKTEKKTSGVLKVNVTNK
ncbi:hypothetical protein [Anaeromicropila populeti]|uniref:Pre-peptidase C-terminal domain-containing protein n=1 Tax=Anaeromicropila populeti TaxID=37658 RepID=A0A1I6I6U7_9FIRM|nr:hypothetical protein [Anaeromicropila populeti]SFR62411.1 hypothetical protein SAMN05661086_00485 [Anaeromicropila populeti]